jgi:hypothetical protein
MGFHQIEDDTCASIAEVDRLTDCEAYSYVADEPLVPMAVIGAIVMPCAVRLVIVWAFVCLETPLAKAFESDRHDFAG